jgi:hypothetical protein
MCARTTRACSRCVTMIPRVRTRRRLRVLQHARHSMGTPVEVSHRAAAFPALGSSLESRLDLWAGIVSVRIRRSSPLPPPSSLPPSRVRGRHPTVRDVTTSPADSLRNARIAKNCCRFFAQCENCKKFGHVHEWRARVARGEISLLKDYCASDISDSSSGSSSEVQTGFGRTRGPQRPLRKFWPPGNIIAGTWPWPRFCISIFCMYATGQDGECHLPPSSPATSPATKSTNIRMN